MFKIVGLGEILWDMLPNGKKLGGAPANFAYHAHALGTQALVVSAVGNDELGREMVGYLDSLALSKEYIATDPAHPTGTVAVDIDREGNPLYVIHENVAWDFIPFTPDMEKLAAEADAVAFGSLAQRSAVSQKSIRSFLAATQPHCLRILDINLRQAYFSKALIHELLGVTSVLKLNDEELPKVAELLGLRGNEDERVEALLERYKLRMVALTRGERGSYLRTPESTSVHPGLKVKVVDTVGAGDAFSAAIALGLLKGMKLGVMNQFANELASYVCTQAGAMPPIPTQLKNFLTR